MEVVLNINNKEKAKYKKIILDAIASTNKELGLNRDMAVDIQFGSSYKDIH